MLKKRICLSLIKVNYKLFLLILLIIGFSVYFLSTITTEAIDSSAQWVGKIYSL